MSLHVHGDAQQASLKTARRDPARSKPVSSDGSNRLLQSAQQLLGLASTPRMPQPFSRRPCPGECPEARVAGVRHPHFPCAHMRVLHARPQQPPLHPVRRLQVPPPSSRRVQGLQEVVPACVGGNADYTAAGRSPHGEQQSVTRSSSSRASYTCSRSSCALKGKLDRMQVRWAGGSANLEGLCSGLQHSGYQPCTGAHGSIFQVVGGWARTGGPQRCPSRPISSPLPSAR